MLGTFIEIRYEGDDKIYYDTNYGYVKSKETYIDNLLNSKDDQPAKTDYFKNGNPMTQIWYQNGNIHREENLGPAVIEYNIHSQIVNQVYYSNGKKHRENGPAQITILNQEEFSESYYNNNKLTGVITKNSITNEVLTESYYHNYNYHHLDKPAYENNYFVFGKKVEKKKLFKSKRILRKGLRKIVSKKRNEIVEILDKSKIKIHDIQMVISRFIY